MSPPSLPGLWAWLAPAAANHIWQSTAFAIAAGLLALALRKNQARVRYWLWLAASLKFLVPCALLMALGSYLAPPRAPTGMQSVYYYAAEIGQPFTESGVAAIASAASTHHLSLAQLLPAVLLSVWFCGFVAVLAFWLLRWRRVHAVVRQAVPVDAGREVEALRRLERGNKIRRPIPLLLSPAPLEPGIFGILRPVLLWPEGISAHLNDAHLEAILAHELRHVRYHDNLAAAMHTLAQAIFWFHPLVWWMGAQMVRERERGCDEEVVAMGSRPGVYAESILKVCEFCVAAPLASFSGVTGADLKKRIVRVMTGGVAYKLDLHKKLLLGIAGITAIAVPLVIGAAIAAQSTSGAEAGKAAAGTVRARTPERAKFDVTVVKPTPPQRLHHLQFDRCPNGGPFLAAGTPLLWIIEFGYGVGDMQVSGGPGWLSSFDAAYDIEGKVDHPVTAAECRLMVQSLLEDRFNLKVHHETRQVAAFALVVGKHGPKLQPAKPATAGGGVRINGAIQQALSEQGVPDGWSMSRLADLVSSFVGRPVVDHTGLPGTYSFSIRFAHTDNSDDPDVRTALQEQLGLKLEPTKTNLDVMVIDDIEKPTPN